MPNVDLLRMTIAELAPMIQNKEVSPVELTEASLAEGEVFDGSVECPRHGSDFDLRTGEPGSFPATTPVPVFGTEIAAGEVFLLFELAGEEAR